MDEIRDYHTKWSKSERQIPCGITYMWYLNYVTNEPIYEQKHSHREQIGGYQGGEGLG